MPFLEILMTKTISPVGYLLLVTVLLGAASLLWLRPWLGDTRWASAAQIVAMGATLVMLVGVWGQLAVQTVVAILGLAQDKAIRDARGRLFAAEDSSGISALPCTRDPVTNRWHSDWEQAADEVSQNWSSVAYLLKIDPVARFLIEAYIVKTRRTILKSHFIALPRIIQRRTTSEGGQSDLWDDFDWLARKAARHLQTSEADAWKLSSHYLAKLR
jgi:hypothetical protein